MDKTQSRLRRAKQTRVKIAELQVARLAVHRTNTHIYAQVFSPCGTKVLASASTLEAEVRAELADKTGRDRCFHSSQILLQLLRREGPFGSAGFSSALLCSRSSFARIHRCPTLPRCSINSTRNVTVSVLNSNM